MKDYQDCYYCSHYDIGKYWCDFKNTGMLPQESCDGGTIKNIKKVPADGNLDCLIAEKLFGWEDASWDSEAHCYTGVEKAGDAKYSRIPLFSTDIATAWKIIEWMKDWQISIDLISPNEWQVVFSDEDSNIEFYSLADTAPLAICRAALKALGVS